MKNCECGCGGRIVPAPHHSYRGTPRFLPGHYQRTAKFRKSRKQLTLKPPKGAIPSGKCECGCGGKTPIAKQSRPKFGQYKGHPVRFLRGHNQRGKTGENSPRWSGGRKKANGYWYVWMPGHHLADSHGYVAEHRLVCEQAYRRRLRPDQHVHHIDGDPTNNAPENLVALTRTAHMALHHKSPMTRSRLSAAHRKRYEDPAERAKTSEAVRRWWKERRA